MELVGYVSILLGFIKAMKEATKASSIDDFLYCIGNTAAAVVAVAMLMFGAAIWLSLFIDIEKLMGHVSGALVVIVCVLTGLYWSFQMKYSVERPWAIGLGALIVISVVYFGYQRIFEPPKPPDET
jgi:chromate transport protein ChrA